MSTSGSSNDHTTLASSVVAITGASGVIGSGIARCFAGTGASLVLHYRSNERSVTRLAKDIPAPTVLVQSDLSQTEGARQVVNAALTGFGKLDVLINNAGIQPLADLGSMSSGEWHDTIDINLSGTHFMTQAAARAMISAGRGGSIISIASIEGLQPAFRHGHYATSKAAIIMHARAAALEFGPENIRVNSVSPGLIDRPELAADWPDGVKRWHAAAPLQRLGTPEDVGDACVFLASPAARWITGHNLVVDGGMSTHPTW